MTYSVMINAPERKESVGATSSLPQAPREPTLSELPSSLVYLPIFLNVFILGFALATIEPRNPAPQTYLVDDERQRNESKKNNKITDWMDQCVHH
jgi:hypothetical protein